MHPGKIIRSLRLDLSDTIYPRLGSQSCPHLPAVKTVVILTFGYLALAASYDGFSLVGGYHTFIMGTSHGPYLLFIE